MPQSDGKPVPEVGFMMFPLLALWLGSSVYCVLAIIAARSYRNAPRPQRLSKFPPVSVLRPLAGASDNTETNLRSLFEQRYPHLEILLSIHEASDPAAAIARRVMADYPDIPAHLIVAGISPLPNAKVWSLRASAAEALYNTIVMTDSDIRLDPDCLRTLISELAQPGVALVTCPYRAVGDSFWSRLEALGLNTDFLSGMLTQRMLNGMDFAIGCTIATRLTELAAIGGLKHLQGFLSEDFVMGNLMHRAGKKVVLSRSVIEHHIGGDSFLANWKHRVRWARGTRRSRRAGYLGEIFTKPVAIALMLSIAAPRAWPWLVVSLLLRAAVVRSTALQILNDPLTKQRWLLLPLEDVASFFTWLLGFFGKTITWRGRKLVLASDGSFEGAVEPPS
ncbi:MAG: glycosyltransferase [Acidobacteriota bacterium]|nr:glycosyltransferase [Acidobacteriota bacterium]